MNDDDDRRLGMMTMEDEGFLWQVLNEVDDRRQSMIMNELQETDDRIK